MTKSKSRKQYEEAQCQIELDPTRQQARRWHIELFPEEYDFIFDNGVDSKKRTKGVSPMNSNYIQRTNLKRQKLGFKPFEIVGENDDTFSWVYKAVKEGKTEIIKSALEIKYQDSSMLNSSPDHLLK
jgi:hypothetical protein